MKLNSVEQLIEDYKQGKMVIIMDDESRENEGDLLAAAQMITAEQINFMTLYGRGLICLTLTDEKCQKLDLPLMVRDNKDANGTNFTVSIEAAKGVSTGISAADRALTVRTAVAKDANSDSIVTPGHIFPLRARPGGVLTRAGHTEAGCDLAKLAGLEESSVLVEIMNEDGTMDRRDDLQKYAKVHNLKIGTVADLIQYRLKNEKTIERVVENKLPTEYGDFRLLGYKDKLQNQVHFALVYGDINSGTEIPVRVHMSDSLYDLFELTSTKENPNWSLSKAMQYIKHLGVGVIVVLGNTENLNNIFARIKSYNSDSIEDENTISRFDNKTYGLGAQILADLGLKKIRIIGSPISTSALSGFGLEVTEFIPKN